MPKGHLFHKNGKLDTTITIDNIAIWNRNQVSNFIEELDTDLPRGEPRTPTKELRARAWDLYTKRLAHEAKQQEEHEANKARRAVLSDVLEKVAVYVKADTDAASRAALHQQRVAQVMRDSVYLAEDVAEITALYKQMRFLITNQGETVAPGVTVTTEDISFALNLFGMRLSHIQQLATAYLRHLGELAPRRDQP